MAGQALGSLQDVQKQSYHLDGNGDVCQRVCVTDFNSDIKNVNIHDENGDPYSNTNPLQVTLVSNELVATHDPAVFVNAIKSVVNNHNLVIPSGKIFSLTQVIASASGKLKVEIKIGDGALVEVFTTKIVGFNSTQAPQADFILSTPIKVLGTVNGTTIRVSITNIDNQNQDLYNTIIGVTLL